MIGQAVKQAALDIWDELLHLILFNMIWFLGAILIIPIPYLTFGLVYTAYDVVEGKSIKIGAFFNHANRTWKQAYIWGGINLVVVVLLWFNLAFYTGVNADWAIILRLFIVALSIFWGVLQIIVLPIYPHLEEPGLKNAYRNALILIGRYPLAVLTLLFFIVLFAVLSFFLQALPILLTFAALAVLATRLMKILVQEELERIGN